MNKKFNMPKVELPVFADKEFNIVDYGAVSDGITKCTSAIQNAIDDCSESGGGVVVIPRGLWYTAPVTMKSNVNLHAESGSVVLFSTDIDDYPLVRSNFEGVPDLRCMSPINGENLENVAITGLGVFDGGGDAWRPVKKFKVTENQWQDLINSGGYTEKTNEGGIHWKSKEAMENSKKIADIDMENAQPEDFPDGHEYFRPMLFNLVKCKKVLLDGITFQNSASWCVHPRLCEHLTVRNVKVRNPWYSQNGDGIDVESCKYVKIDNCTFDVGDDAICMKAGKDEPGRRMGVATEFVEISNCIVYHGHGGFVVGSEMSAGVKNVCVSNCSFVGTDTGLRFKSCRGRGGVVENIFIENIAMTSMKHEAIVFSTYYASNGEPDAEVLVSEKTPVFRNMRIKNVTVSGCSSAIEVVGLPEMPISDIEFNNIKIKSEKKGIALENTENITLKDVVITTPSGVDAY